MTSTPAGPDAPRDTGVAQGSRAASPAWAWVASGVLAGVLGLFVATWSTALMTARADPVEAMAELVIELTPGRAAVAAVEATGSMDKPLLIAGIWTVALLGTALAGRLRRRSSISSAAVLLGLALLAGIAVAARDGAGVVGLAPVAFGALTWLLALELLTAPLARADSAAEAAAAPGADSGGDVVAPPAGGVFDGGRRSFVTRAALGVLAATGLGIGATAAAADRERTDRVRRTLSRTLRTTARTTPGRVPAGADLGIDGLVPWQVPNQDFYRIDTAIVLPEVSVEDWSLRIHGLVDGELVLTYEDLTSGRYGTTVEDWVTIACVSNPVGGDLIGNAWWSGVRIAPILRGLGLDPSADAVLQTSVDGWSCATPLQALTDDRSAILAFAMNGEPLPVEHGFPVRMIVPGLYGYVSATKWVTDLEVTRFDEVEAFWTQRGWTEKGPIKTMSRVDVPRSGDEVPAGGVTLGGFAWAQGTGVDRVEYQLDGGPWAEARLAEAVGVDTWVQWSADVRVDPGEHRVRVRATDASGYTQTRAVADVFPDGATGWDAHTFVAT